MKTSTSWLRPWLSSTSPAAAAPPTLDYGRGSPSNAHPPPRPWPCRQRTTRPPLPAHGGSCGRPRLSGSPPRQCCPRLRPLRRRPSRRGCRPRPSIRGAATRLALAWSIQAVDDRPKLPISAHSTARRRPGRHPRCPSLSTPLLFFRRTFSTQLWAADDNNIFCDAILDEQQCTDHSSWRLKPARIQQLLDCS